ncbi:hypothetical protein C8J56DRAFT_779264 [Mycena floridula]|nr:hypothetical protein C8J56DRAFT_779264 [Mycena floridula]
MPTHYTPLPTRSEPAGRELNDAELDEAFESDDEDVNHSETTPLQRRSAGHSIEPIPGTYDFERDYDYPPPGSPPPAHLAFANDFGNTNGLLPTSPVAVRPTGPSQPFFRRIVGSILPTHYAQVPSSSRPSVRGGGIDNDGVFANVMAKPQPAQVVQTEDGQTHIVPEDSQKEAPPSYATAQADAAPPYWETPTVHALSSDSEMIIEQLPAGPFWVFCVNLIASWTFQLLGFAVTYVVHTSHAGKYGSRAGLGLTLIQYGFYSRSVISDETVPGDEPPATDSNNVSTDPSGDSMVNPTSGDWISFMLMTIGWFLLLSSVAGYLRVKRWESSIRSTSAPLTRADIENDIAVRRDLESVFGIQIEEQQLQTPRGRVQTDERGHVIVLPGAEALEEARLQRDLQAAGLL